MDDVPFDKNSVYMMRFKPTNTINEIGQDVIRENPINYPYNFWK